MCEEQAHIFKQRNWSQSQCALLFELTQTGNMIDWWQPNNSFIIFGREWDCKTDLLKIWERIIQAASTGYYSGSVSGT